MKHLSFVLLYILVSFTVLGQKEVKDPNLDEFGRLFMAALNSKNIENVLSLKPSPAIWKAAMPNETKSLSDKQLLEINKSEKFITDFNNIIESAKNSGIKLEDLEYIGALYGENEAGKMIGISLKYKYHGEEINFPVSLLRYKSKFYLSEILMSYNIFSRNNLGK